MPRPDPPSSLGNPAPPHERLLDLPELPPQRAGRVVEFGTGWQGPPLADLARARSILVVALDFIGDWVLTTPFLAGLRRSAPQAQITAVVLERAFDLAAPCAFVDRVIAAAPADHGPLRFGAEEAALVDGFVEDYRAGAFDLALVPRWDTDFNGATRLAGLSGADAVIGFSETCTERRRRDNAGFDRLYTTALVDRRVVHETERALALLEALGGESPGNDPVLHLREEDHAAAGAFLASAFPESVRPLLAVAPFAAGRKQYPVELTAALVASLARRFGMDVAVVGSPDHAEAADAFARSLGAGAASSARVLGIRANAALIGRAAFLLGMDSGPGHIAGAMGTPSAIVFSNAFGSAPLYLGAPERFRPLGAPVHAIRPAVPLAPCTDGCEADEPHCIASIAPDDVLPDLAAFVAEAIARREGR